MRKLKPAKVHEQAAVGPWTQLKYAAPHQQTAYYNHSSQSKILEAAFHHMHRVQVSSLKNKMTKGISGHFVCQHNAMHRYTSLTERFTWEQGPILCPCTSTGHCLETRNQTPTVLINGYGAFPVKIKGLCTLVLHTGNQTTWKAMFQVTNTKGYLILHHKTAQQTDFIHFPMITPSQLT